MKKVIIAIHGLGNKPATNLLRESWLNAVVEGLKNAGKAHFDIPFEMVYWADISYREPWDPNIEDPADPLYLEEPYTPAPTTPLLLRPQRFFISILQFIENHLDRLLLKTNLTETFPDLSSKMIKRYFSDLDTYYTDACLSKDGTDCSAKSAIQKRLADTLEQYKGYEILLISHSMGSIIAFDVLSNPSHDFKIHTFVSMGSPLGLPPIVSRNYVEQKTYQPDLLKPHVPEGIWPHWYNLSDRRDTVALDHTLRDDYTPNSKGLKVVDLLVTNDYFVNGQSNPHKSFGYLRAPAMARIIDTFLTEDRFRGFKNKCALILGNITTPVSRTIKAEKE